MIYVRNDKITIHQEIELSNGKLNKFVRWTNCDTVEIIRIAEVANWKIENTDELKYPWKSSKLNLLKITKNHQTVR